MNDFELDGMDYQRLVTGQFQLNPGHDRGSRQPRDGNFGHGCDGHKDTARLGAEDVDYAITPEEYAIVEQSANAFIARQL